MNNQSLKEDSLHRIQKLEAENQILRAELDALKQSAGKPEESDPIYRILAANIPGTAITILDREERYLLAEGDFLKTMGYEKETMPGKKISDVITPKNYEYYQDIIRRAFDGETILVERQTLSTFWSLMKVVPLRDKKNEVFAIMFALIDVTPVKQAQFDLQRLNEELEGIVDRRTQELSALNKQLESFSYSVSHDLRAPLRAISGYTQALKEDYSDKLNDPEFNTLADVIVRNAMKMSTLIDDLLQFSKLGRQQIRSETIDMNGLANEVIAELLPVGSEKKPEINLTALPPAHGDISMIRQVWTNLVSNAVKYSRKTALARIEIGFKQDNGKDCYYVADNGAGFDMEHYPKLFGVFQRLHKASEFEGTGVGLSFVKTIVERHGGEIWAVGELGKGATFYFTLNT